jgi:hypothetical protein
MLSRRYVVEKWAVAYGPYDPGRSKFLFARARNGKIAVFASEWEARQWVLSGSPLTPDDDVIYIKLPAATTG